MQNIVHIHFFFHIFVDKIVGGTLNYTFSFEKEREEIVSNALLSGFIFVLVCATYLNLSINVYICLLCTSIITLGNIYIYIFYLFIFLENIN